MERIDQIYRVLSGTATAADQADLHRWIDADELNREEYLNLKLLWENTQSSSHDPKELERGIRRIRGRIKVRTTGASAAAVKLLMVISLVAAVIAVSFYLSRVYTDKHNLVRMQFEDTALGEVCNTMELSYGMKISLTPPIAGCKFSGSFYNEPTEKALTAIASKLGLAVSKTGSRSYSISGDNCR